MNERMQAEEHLRVIRSLMERATVYRAISAPTALVGGLSALAVSAWLIWVPTGSAAASEFQTGFTAREFLPAWLISLALTVVANTLFVWREARRDGRPFFSPGLRLALRSVIPSLLLAAVISFAAWRDQSNTLNGSFLLALTWIGLYGVALLSTMNFAPTSLLFLGASFVMAAVVWLLLLSAPSLRYNEPLHGPFGATVPMAITFGLFHLVYAACTWPRRRTPERAQSVSE
jgi:hypothetical protein